jgi:hypothetical protein
MKLEVSLPFPQEHAIGCYHEPVEYCSQPNTIFLTFVLILSFHLSLDFRSIFFTYYDYNFVCFSQAIMLATCPT